MHTFAQYPVGICQNLRICLIIDIQIDNLAQQNYSFLYLQIEEGVLDYDDPQQKLSNTLRLQEVQHLDWLRFINVFYDSGRIRGDQVNENSDNVTGNDIVRSGVKVVQQSSENDLAGVLGILSEEHLINFRKHGGEEFSCNHGYFEGPEFVVGWSWDDEQVDDFNGGL